MALHRDMSYVFPSSTAIVPAASFLAFLLLNCLSDVSFARNPSSASLGPGVSAFRRFEGGIRFCRFASRAVASYIGIELVIQCIIQP